MEITQQLLRELFTYDKATGRLLNKVRRKNVSVGREAGCVGNKGYRRVKINNVEYATHRLVWMYTYGVWPMKQLDHIDRDPLNNRVNNLREADTAQNRQNINRPRSNTSGYLGVTWNKCVNKWQAVIGVGGVCKYLGVFTTPEAAHEAYLAAKAKLHTFNPFYHGVTS